MRLVHPRELQNSIGAELDPQDRQGPSAVLRVVVGVVFSEQLGIDNRHIRITFADTAHQGFDSKRLLPYRERAPSDVEEIFEEILRNDAWNRSDQQRALFDSAYEVIRISLDVYERHLLRQASLNIQGDPNYDDRVTAS